MQRKNTNNKQVIIQPNSILLDLDILLVSENIIKSTAPLLEDDIKHFSYLIENIILLDKIYMPIMGSDLSTKKNIDLLTSSKIYKKLYFEAENRPLVLIMESPEIESPTQGVYLQDLGLKSSYTFSNFLSHKLDRYMKLGQRNELSYEDSIRNKIFREMMRDEKCYNKLLSTFFNKSGYDIDTIIEKYLKHRTFRVLKDYFNIELSKYMGISYQPRPELDFLYLADSLYEAGLISSFSQFTNQWITNLRDELIQLRFKGYESAFFELNIPFLFAIVLREAKTLADCIDIALQVRNLKSVSSYRKWATEITLELRDRKSGRKLANAKRELDNLSELIKLELGIKESRFDVSLWLFSISERIPDILHKPLWIRPHLRFLRDAALRSYEILGLKSELGRILEPK